MTSASIERAAALAALALGQPAADEGGAAPRLERTGRTLDVGGETERLLVRPASTLGHRLKDGSYQRVKAVPGDVVRLLAAEARRLDALGVTVEVDADLDVVEEQQADGTPTDEELKAYGAAELVAYVGQHPEERPRVKALEETRAPSQQRSSVLAACEETPAEDEAAQADADARAQAEAQQHNDGGATGE